MKYLKVFLVVLFLTGCAAQEPQGPVREPSKLINRDVYDAILKVLTSFMTGLYQYIILLELNYSF